MAQKVTRVCDRCKKAEGATPVSFNLETCIDGAGAQAMRCKAVDLCGPCAVRTLQDLLQFIERFPKRDLQALFGGRDLIADFAETGWLKAVERSVS